MGRSPSLWPASENISSADRAGELVVLVANRLTQRFLLHGRPRTLFQDLSFTLSAGERLAVLGRNGQGKSTLIKILGGVLMQSGGTVTWSNMSCSWPLAYTGAMQGSLTGMDNILFISRIYRCPLQETIRRTEEFAELGPALTQPVKYYSTGMRARLAFGLSMAIDFDCYLIDEVISVGDALFQQKCRTELFDKRANRTFVIASHDLHFVREMCTRAIVIEAGQATLYEEVDAAIEAVWARAKQEPAE
jgi:capsular polysaccharide transport system ATP-binding protein